MASQDSEEMDLKKVELWNVDESLESYGANRMARSQVENKYKGLIKFLNENGMFKKKRRVVDASGKLLVRQVFVGDLTDEGFRFVKEVLKPWLRSKTAAENPANTAILEKYLKKVRGT
ncbi:hypothetical protein [Caballeronia grimmiae]|nr:hypothetical protein [Caballeronia grimmiae]